MRDQTGSLVYKPKTPPTSYIILYYITLYDVIISCYNLYNNIITYMI